MDDLIALTAQCGIQTEWRFPKKIKHCPTKNCYAKFEHRSHAILHYRKYHSNSILCPVCDRPISAKSLHNFVHHFKEKHAEEELPANVKEKIVKKRKFDELVEVRNFRS